MRNSRRAGKPAGRKPEKQGLTGLFTKGKNIPTTAQQTLPYREMYRDGVCRVADRYYTKTIEYEDINYQLAQSEDQAAIFDGWSACLNYFDSSLPFQLSFLNHRSRPGSRYSVNIPMQDDDYNSVRCEYVEMLENQIAKSNNGIVRTKLLTFGVNVDDLSTARARLARGTERRDLLETVQGYVILKAATFETGHGFALGHNPGAPSPFVTWQFTEGENGHRDYYWGRYGTSQAWAQRDFDRRVDDYQQLYHAAVKHTELGPEGVYRYYSTQRPVDIGTYPKPPDNQPLSIVNYDDDRRRPVADGRLMAWGELTYAKPLTEKQMEDYELKPAPGNPDRVHPSITARLKEGTRGQKPPKEPGQKRSHKNHEER